MDNILKMAMEINKCGIQSVNEAPVRLFWLRATGSEIDRYVITERKHHHTFFEMHFILYGTVEYKTENDDIRLNEGDCVLFSPGTRHMLSSHSTSFVKLTAAFCVAESDGLFDALVKKSSAVIEGDDIIGDCVDFILKSAKNAGCYSPLLIKNRVLEMICMTAGNVSGGKTGSEREELADERVFCAKKYVDDNTSLFLTCNEVAAYCHISPRQLTRLFKRYEGMSLFDYIHKRKTAAAKLMLSNSGKTLGQIGAELGFSDEYYFNNFFKKHTGMTPGDYRKAAMDAGDC